MFVIERERERERERELARKRQRGKFGDRERERERQREIMSLFSVVADLAWTFPAEEYNNSAVICPIRGSPVPEGGATSAAELAGVPKRSRVGCWWSSRRWYSAAMSSRFDKEVVTVTALRGCRYCCCCCCWCSKQEMVGAPLRRGRRRRRRRR